jgi:CTP synthase
VLGLKQAHSTEMNDSTDSPVICMMEEQKKITQMGGTMRLGAYGCELKEGSKVAAIYNSHAITERHRHRYEFNNDYLEAYEAAGMKATGINPETGLVEIMELPNHPYFVAVQFHPEYKSSVENPHPLFVAFVQAAKDARNRNGNTEKVFEKSVAH